MKIFLGIVITLVVLAVVTVVLIKKSVKTQETKVNWLALVQGQLTIMVNMHFLLPFAVTIDNFKAALEAGGIEYFVAEMPVLKLNPGLNTISLTFKSSAKLDALGVAGLITQKKYLNISGTVLGLSFERTEELS